MRILTSSGRDKRIRPGLDKVSKCLDISVARTLSITIRLAAHKDWQLVQGSNWKKPPNMLNESLKQFTIVRLRSVKSLSSKPLQEKGITQEQNCEQAVSAKSVLQRGQAKQLSLQVLEDSFNLEGHMLIIYSTNNVQKCLTRGFWQKACA